MTQPSSTSRRATFFLMAAILLVGLFYRGAGLYRGLDDGTVYHPDAPKQVMMLYNYTHGNYLQYFDSWFYDGYPYGLNRVDELFVRSIRGVTRPVMAWLNPEAAPEWMPDRGELFYWARSLRVVYGLAVVVLIFLALRAFGAGTGPSLAGSLVYAFSPLGVTVAHVASGDIGVDLFIAFSIWSVARYTREGRARWVVLTGLFLGMAFACKYQGVLGLWIIGLTLLLSARPVGRLFRSAGLILPGLIAGMLMLTPAFFYDTSKTWKNIRINFQRIKDYDVPESFLELPLVERVSQGLSGNIPLVLHGLGLVVSILALVSLVFCARRYLRCGTDDTQERRRAAAMIGLTTFPVIAILLSTALKPSIQPFHFSYLLPVMAVAVGLLLSQVTVASPLLRRIAVLAFFLGLAFETLPEIRREHFMWSRPESTFEAYAYAPRVFEDGAGVSRSVAGSRTVRTFYNDPSTLPVFRNRPSRLTHQDADWWGERHILSVPTVPLPDASDWIFLNGPVFPRNDRMFAVPAAGPGLAAHPYDEAGGAALIRSHGRFGVPRTEKLLVFHEKPGPIKLGMRTGYLPSRYRIEVSGEEHTGLLLPQSQLVVELDALDAAVHYGASGGRPEVFIVPLSAAAQLGPVWVTVLTDEREVRNFARFGPDASGPLMNSDEAADASVRLESVHYCAVNEPIALSERSLVLKDAGPLAAGAYRMTAEVYNPGEAQVVTFEYRDPGDSTGGWVQEHRATEGASTLEWVIQKNYAPYDGLLTVRAESEGPLLLSWNLKPDAEAMTDWSRVNTDNGESADVKAVPLGDGGVTFPGLGNLVALELPTVVAGGEAFRYTVRFELDPEISHRDFFEGVIFLHVKDGEGTMVKALDFPLMLASFSDNGISWREQVMDAGTAPGTYVIEGGIYNGRLRTRYPFRAFEGMTGRVDKGYFRVTDLVIK